MTQDYKPNLVPLAPEELARYIHEELTRLSHLLPEKNARMIEFKHAEPVRPREGMLYGADGTNWNPGQGKGVYVYYDGVWNKLGCCEGSDPDPDPDPEPEPEPPAPPESIFPAFINSALMGSLGVVDIHSYSNTSWFEGEDFATSQYAIDTSANTSVLSVTAGTAKDGSIGIFSTPVQAGIGANEYFHHYNYNGPTRYAYRYETAVKDQKFGEDTVKLDAYIFMADNTAIVYGALELTDANTQRIGLCTLDPVAKTNTITSFDALSSVDFPTNTVVDAELGRTHTYDLTGHIRLSDTLVAFSIQRTSRLYLLENPSTQGPNTYSQGFVMVSLSEGTLTVGAPFWYQLFKESSFDNRFIPFFFFAIGSTLYTLGSIQGFTRWRLFAVNYSGIGLSATHGFFSYDPNTLRSADWWLLDPNTTPTLAVTGVDSASCALLYIEPGFSTTDAFVALLKAGTTIVDSTSVPNIDWRSGSMQVNMANLAQEVGATRTKFMPSSDTALLTFNMHAIPDMSKVWLVVTRWDVANSGGTSSGCEIVTQIVDFT